MLAALIALPATILAWFAGPVLFFLSRCLDSRTDCAAYSPVRQTIAYLIAWPVLAILLNISNTTSNEFVAFILLATYYYGLIYAAIYLWRRVSK
jgi:hypothetical protein